MNNIFSNNLKKLRLQKKLTQEQVAEILGVNSQTVSRWECNTTYPDIMLLPEIAQLYCITVDDLFKETSIAYENYAQKLASIYDVTRKPEDFFRADEEFNKLIKNGKYSLEDCREHGTIHCSMMEYCKQNAIEKLNQVINEYEKNNNVSPENQIYWKTRYQIIRYYIEIGKASYICQIQKERLKKYSEDYMEWVALIYAYDHTGIFNEAYDYFLQAKEKFPDIYVIYDIGSNVCRALKKYDEAINCCDKAFEYGSKFLDSLYAKAFCLEEMGDYKSAYSTWIKIVESLKKDGYNIEAEKELERAEQCLEKIKQ